MMAMQMIKVMQPQGKMQGRMHVKTHGKMQMQAQTLMQKLAMNLTLPAQTRSTQNPARSSPLSLGRGLG